ncbi:D-isomer specific 2-hydroxyacid dehydrogenase, NAD-binding [Candidatus Sulfopaludibacter sp. SbA4]|nr:D-isomer specific 2-hydroxyacid dehydrogenase, NAD-binding [Candidatus Sulfopaludibacter sp. SbA4]
MDNNTVVVLANPTEPQLAMLEQLPPETSIAVGNSAEAFARAAPEANVIFNWSLSGGLLREVFLMCPRVQWVHSRAAGLDGMLFPELIESPVPVTNGSGVFSQSLGEFALAAILFFAKDLRRMVSNQMAGVWEQFDILEVTGQTVGIVGYGDIGRAVATRVRAMGMHVLAVRRHGAPVYHVDPLVNRVYTPGERIEMISRSDYIVVSAPLTPETRGMIGEEEFAAMKPEAVVINLGRGPTIDEGAMVRALSGRRIKGAALDVFDEEPLPEGHPFYRLENVLLSPHCADHTADWMEQAMQFFIDQFARFRKGEPLLNVVNKKLGY